MTSPFAFGSGESCVSSPVSRVHSIVVLEHRCSDGRKLSAQSRGRTLEPQAFVSTDIGEIGCELEMEGTLRGRCQRHLEKSCELSSRGPRGAFRDVGTHRNGGSSKLRSQSVHLRVRKGGRRLVDVERQLVTGLPHPQLLVVAHQTETDTVSCSLKGACRDSGLRTPDSGLMSDPEDQT